MKDEDIFFGKSDEDFIEDYNDMIDRHNDSVREYTPEIYNKMLNALPKLDSLISNMPENGYIYSSSEPATVPEDKDGTLLFNDIDMSIQMGLTSEKAVSKYIEEHIQEKIDSVVNEPKSNNNALDILFHGAMDYEKPDVAFKGYSLIKMAEVLKNRQVELLKKGIEEMQQLINKAEDEFKDLVEEGYKGFSHKLDAPHGWDKSYEWYEALYKYKNTLLYYSESGVDFERYLHLKNISLEDAFNKKFKNAFNLETMMIEELNS